MNSLRYLQRLDSLEELDLQWWTISDKGLNPLYRMKNLRKLYLAGTSVTAAGIEKLQAAIPGLQVDDGTSGVRNIENRD